MVKHTVTNCLFDIVFAITYLQKTAPAIQHRLAALP